MNRDHIREEVRKLQLEIWNKRELLFPNLQVKALQVLEPSVMAEVLGIEYLELDNLGDQIFSFRGKGFEVAGLVDRQARKIAVSNKYSDKFTRFTAGHEIGHWVLHPGEVMHRDKPLDGSEMNYMKPVVEKEADYFSACFYMPAPLVSKIFQELFQTALPFVFHETNAFHVSPQKSDILLSAEPNSLERERALASCRSFGRNHFNSLSDIFRVSETAMAIRLRELKLVQWP